VALGITGFLVWVRATVLLRGHCARYQGHLARVKQEIEGSPGNR
jgi:hypothetical protein